MSNEKKYCEYQYLVTYTSIDRENGLNPLTRRTPLTIPDLKSKMIAAEIVEEIKSRIEEIEQVKKHNLQIEIISVNLLATTRYN